ncbi:FprA family A-type flavoprotein [Enterorhabdus mucosicola]|uniref:FprA family A-type flavoprotein n=1 Tax=Adlercreutzia mucosicola TaxID=580026 RepID=A0A6N8JPL3_9ACTN|nr:FprA family A-type flavoprotein [Adlercreutzia mucosicola]MVX60999.1 FprA family A-type flavoprotein [Adlercreutzia mucosicola]
MLKAVEIKPDVFWVGGIDWNERNFHGYTTERGSTYNAYLILDEQITLIDTCKRPFTGELIDRISDIVDPASIAYVVSNHVEMDHSGGLPALAAIVPDATIVTGEPKGVRGLRAHYGDGLNLMGVKTGDTLNIGKRTLTFVQTPMVHWPDSMVTYDEYDKILFSNDSFGQHYASSKRFDDEVGLPEVLVQAQKHYANIVMPYGKNVEAALKTLAAYHFDMIAPAHGIIWRTHVPEILDCYRQWSSGEPEEYVLVVYDSMWHTTEAMAVEITEAFMEMGIPARLLDLKVNHISDIMAEVLCARYIAVGSPTLNKTMMPTVAAFLCYMRGLAPAGRVGIPFGSYGWAPMGPNEVYQQLESCKFTLPEAPFTHQWVEDEEGLTRLHDEVIQFVSLFHAKA